MCILDCNHVNTNLLDCYILVHIYVRFIFHLDNHYCLVRIYFENNNYLLICIKILKVNLNSVYHVHKRYWKQSPFFGIVCQVPLHPIFILSFRVYNDNNIVFFESKFIFVICLTIVKCAAFSSFCLKNKNINK